MKAFIHRHLDPSDRMTEVLFGVIMTLTFTLGASLVVEEGPEAVREMLVGVIGSNLAWGIIDGLLYVFGAMYERGGAFRAARVLAERGEPAAGELIAAHLDGAFGPALSAETRAAVRREVCEHLARAKPGPVRMTAGDLGGAVASFVLVVSTSIPAVLPFLFIDDRLTALRVSNLLLIGLLYAVGTAWGRAIRGSGRLVGLAMALGGLLLVQLTILLGG